MTVFNFKPCHVETDGSVDYPQPAVMFIHNLVLIPEQQQSHEH